MSKRGFFALVGNRADSLQRRGHHPVSQKIFFADGVIELYLSPFLYSDTSGGFLARLIFLVGIMIAMKPSALVKLTRKQFKKQ